MSRIQDILAKAEREGMTRRTQAEPTFASTPSAAVIAPVNGSAALDSSPYLTAPPPIAAVPTLDTRPAVEPRTARATLHPALVAAIAPHSAIAEQYRAIRTRMAHHEDGGPLRNILITSPGAREGKSITAANLALTMAQEFQRNVVLVDADLRGSSVHTLFGLDASPGLADVLAGDATLDEALVYLPDYRLTILPAGRTPQFPTELLGAATMRRSMDTLRARFDRILIDLPAVAPLADVGTVAPLADGVVLVVRAGITQRPALEQALGVFEESKVLGVVLNDAR
ncbi:MAG TPA: CpsD/CapB family tyrosine-protein kinase [Vicinamibacterales bacterium]|jgi:capsular exopolysaccharide synthesis family protein|nr:CpsD/CapB family tyrosine-protein kinase [Vicinamibacterales bacterium]